MCVSVDKADFSGTTIVLNDIDPNFLGQPTHVMLYQNKRRNLSPGPNAMLLHIDVAPGYPMGPKNFIDSTAFKHVADDMVKAITPTSRGSYDFGIAKSVQVIEVGSYTVLLAPDARDLTLALTKVPEHKRPRLNTALFDFYARYFPGRSVALCCFEQSAEEVEPMMFWWHPRNPAEFVLPALDEHTGNVPVFGQLVDVDHNLIVGSYKSTGGIEVDYREERNIPREVRALLPNRVVGCHVGGKLPNGDFLISSDKVQEALRFGDLDKTDFYRSMPEITM